MKKINVLVLSTAIATASLVVSCQGGGNINTNVSLNTEIDSLSYAFGTNMIETGLKQALEQQLGILTDTSMFKMQLQQMIAVEKDSAKKAALINEIPAKVDSVKRANIKNMDVFLKALNEAINSTGDDKNAYYAGLSVGNQLKQYAKGYEDNVLDAGQKLDKRIIASAVAAGLKSQTPLLSNSSEIIQSKAMAKQEAQAKKQEEEAKAQYAEKIAEGEKFLEENKTKEGVVVLPIGLQYKILKEGKGEKPKAADKVNVTYRGTLIDGSEFETATTSFGVGQVIKGWTEALQLMPVGSKWILYIPYDLAYG
ncbi:MAG TPA: hypothetical protein DIT04_10665 [Dysgonomonas sp.]|nr:hypothetical protein [Dysgonomonas sp.]